MSMNSRHTFQKHKMHPTRTTMAKSYTQEPASEYYKTLEADIYEDEEFYVYKVGHHELIRKKIGGWINLSKFLPFIKPGDAKAAEKDTKGYKVFFKFSDPHVLPRYQGIWVRLKDARIFADAYEILHYTLPILAFERIAKVSYHGFEFYEYFCNIDYETNIRILRDVHNNNINMKQIFICYNKLKSDKKNITIQERNFYNYYRDHYSKKITVRNDSSLCGGFWIPYKDARLYTSKHGFLKRLLPILDFETTPSEAKQYPVDTFQGSQRRYWRATACDDDFFGFPMSFSGGGAPDRPANKRRFRMDEMTCRTTIKTDITRENVQTDYSFTLIKRLSDGWVNASAVVRVGCMLRVKELNFGKSDPELVNLAEMYYRDQIQNFENEPITSPISKVLNGKWCSRRNIREICKELKLYSTESAKPVIEFIEDGAESESGSESDDEEIELLKDESSGVFSDVRSSQLEKKRVITTDQHPDFEKAVQDKHSIESDSTVLLADKAEDLKKNGATPIKPSQLPSLWSSTQSQALKSPSRKLGDQVASRQTYPYGTVKVSMTLNYPYGLPKRSQLTHAASKQIPTTAPPHTRDLTPYSFGRPQLTSSYNTFQHAQLYYPNGTAMYYPHGTPQLAPSQPVYSTAYRTHHPLSQDFAYRTPKYKPPAAASSPAFLSSSMKMALEELNSIEEATMKSKRRKLSNDRNLEVHTGKK